MRPRKVLYPSQNISKNEPTQINAFSTNFELNTLHLVDQFCLYFETKGVVYKSNYSITSFGLPCEGHRL